MMDFYADALATTATECRLSFYLQPELFRKWHISSTDLFFCPNASVDRYASAFSAHPCQTNCWAAFIHFFFLTVSVFDAAHHKCFSPKILKVFHKKTSYEIIKVGVSMTVPFGIACCSPVRLTIFTFPLMTTSPLNRTSPSISRDSQSMSDGGPSGKRAFN